MESIGDVGLISLSAGQLYESGDGLIRLLHYEREEHKWVPAKLIFFVAPGNACCEGRERLRIRGAERVSATFAEKQQTLDGRRKRGWRRRGQWVRTWGPEEGPNVGTSGNKYSLRQPARAQNTSRSRSDHSPRPQTRPLGFFLSVAPTMPWRPCRTATRILRTTQLGPYIYFFFFFCSKYYESL